MNVTNVSEKILSLLNVDSTLIAKAKIACLFHDVGALEGKDDHALRSYEFTKKYFIEHNITFDGIEDVLEAIKIHSDGFETDNLIALVIILADKLDVKKDRIAKEGTKVIGNRQYSHINDIQIDIKDNYLIVNFITDDEIDIKELNEYYFTKKIFKAVDTFAKKFSLNFMMKLNNKLWNVD